MERRQGHSDWTDELLKAVLTSVQDDTYWNNKFTCATNFAVHLAVFNEPYLQFLLEGSKTVESRFSIKRCPPYNHVQPGDVLILKKSSGPVVGLCQIGFVWFYQIDSTSWKEIQDTFSVALGVQDAHFWEERENTFFATLMRVENVKTIAPITCKKRDRRGWVVLKYRGLEGSEDMKE